MNYTFIFKNRDAAEKFYELIKCECSNASNLRRYIDCDYNGDYEQYSWLVDVKLDEKQFNPMKVLSEYEQELLKECRSYYPIEDNEQLMFEFWMEKKHGTK